VGPSGLRRTPSARFTAPMDQRCGLRGAASRFIDGFMGHAWVFSAEFIEAVARAGRWRLEFRGASTSARSCATDLRLPFATAPFQEFLRFRQATRNSALFLQRWAISRLAAVGYFLHLFILRGRSRRRSPVSRESLALPRARGEKFLNLADAGVAHTYKEVSASRDRLRTLFGYRRRIVRLSPRSC